MIKDFEYKRVDSPTVRKSTEESAEEEEARKILKAASPEKRALMRELAEKMIDRERKRRS